MTRRGHVINVVMRKIKEVGISSPIIIVINVKSYNYPITLIAAIIAELSHRKPGIISVVRKNSSSIIFVVPIKSYILYDQMEIATIFTELTEWCIK